MDEDKRYQAYVETVMSLNGSLATANAELVRARAAIQRKSSAEQRRLQTQLREFDGKVKSYEDSYAKTVDALEQARNLGLTVSMPRKVRPVDTTEDVDVLLALQRSLIRDVTSGIEVFKRAQEYELDQQKAQAAIKALEAKRAAEALAARNAVLSNRNKPEPKTEAEPKKSSNVGLIVGAIAAIVIVALVIIFVL